MESVFNTATSLPPVLTPTSSISLEDIEGIRKVKFGEWQRKFIESSHHSIVLCCGRKSGKTEAIAAKIALFAMNNIFPERCDGVCITSNGMRAAKDLLFTIHTILKMLGEEFQKDLQSDEAYGSVTRLRLSNGNWIQAFPCGHQGDTIRPYNFIMLVEDEAAYIPDAVEEAISACLSVYGMQRIKSSSPAGPGGVFYDAYFSPDWERFHVKSSECSWVNKAFLAREKRKDPRSYKQEYDAEFTDIADGIYPRQLIAACSGRQIDWEEVKKTASCLFLGADFAHFGEHENTVAYNYYKDGISYIKVTVKTSKYRTTESAGMIAAIAKSDPKFKLVVTDQTGGGEGPTDILVETLGKRKVIGVKNQAREHGKYMKVHLHNNLLTMMEQGKVVLDSDTAIVRSLRSMRWRYGLNNKLTIGGRDSHVAEAIVRAVFPLLIKKPMGDIFFRAVEHRNA